MARIVHWTPKAERTFARVIDYLEQEWTEKEIAKFVKKTFAVIGLISQNPELFVATKSKHIRKALITKHNSLVYRIKKDEIELLFFWDNRQHPKKFKPK